MYYQNYEDYMKSVLGYPIENRNTYAMNNTNEEVNYNYIQNRNNKEIEEMYPEIYKRVNPVVCEVCDKCNMPLTRDLLENLTNEVFKRIEVGNEVHVKINIDNKISEKEVVTNSKQMNNNINITNRQQRQNNPFLRDLIQILILNRILGGGGVFFPPVRPPRPPFPRDYL